MTVRSLPTEGKYGIWGKFGSVYNPRTRRYMRIGLDNQTYKVIANELPRNQEWHKRVKFMANNFERTEFGKKLKELLADA